MLSKPKKLTDKEKKELKLKKLTQVFGEDIQKTSDEMGEEEEVIDDDDDDINDLAEIVIDNDVYDEELIELTMEHEETSSHSVEIPDKKSKQSSKIPKVSKPKPVHKSKRKKTTMSPEFSDNEVSSKVRKRNTSSRTQVHEDISRPNTDATLRRSSRQRRPNVNYTD